MQKLTQINIWHDKGKCSRKCSYLGWKWREVGQGYGVKGEFCALFEAWLDVNQCYECKKLTTRHDKLPEIDPDGKD